MIRNYIIKLLGGYTNNEYNSVKYSLDNINTSFNTVMKLLKESPLIVTKKSLQNKTFRNCRLIVLDSTISNCTFHTINSRYPVIEVIANPIGKPVHLSNCSVINNTKKPYTGIYIK